MRDVMGIIGIILAWFVLAALTFGAWIQHVVTCIQDGSWGFLIAGAIMFPIAIIHGWMIWLGAV